MGGSLWYAFGMDEKNQDMDKGAQPLDALLIKLAIKNSELVDHSTEQLSHKMVAKGRKGRRLTLNIQMKILKALNARVPDANYTLKDLFNYEGKK